MKKSIQVQVFLRTPQYTNIKIFHPFSQQMKVPFHHQACPENLHLAYSLVMQHKQLYRQANATHSHIQPLVFSSKKSLLSSILQHKES